MSESGTVVANFGDSGVISPDHGDGILWFGYDPYGDLNCVKSNQFAAFSEPYRALVPGMRVYYDLDAKGLATNVRFLEPATVTAATDAAADSLEAAMAILGSDFEPADADRLSVAQVDALLEGLGKWFRGWRAPPPQTGEMRICAHVGTGLAPIRFTELALFAHSIVVRDPLEDWVTLVNRFRDLDEYGRSRGALRKALTASIALKEAVQLGFVLKAPYPPARPTARRWEPLEDDTRPEHWAALMPNPAFARAVLGELPGSEWQWRMAVSSGESSDAEERLRWSFAKDVPDHDQALGTVEAAIRDRAGKLSLANWAKSHFHATNAVDAAYIEAILGQPVRRPGAPSDADLAVVPLLRDVLVPVIDRLRVSDLVAIRKNADEFEEWRLWLRKLLLDAVAVSHATGVPADALAIEEMKNAATAARRATSRSRALAGYVQREAPIALTSMAAAGGLFGVEAAAGTAIAALVRAAWAGLRPEAPDAHSGVLLQVLRDPK